MDYLIIIYENGNEGRSQAPEIKNKILCNENEMYNFVQENCRDEGVKFTVNKIKCLLDFS